eukprot:CAMPEP_0185751878 /NCGR_PEP_ID=MMETSP1174-20130828/10657_1 /TAXON_ID=35687 /ORGANISM="Dictyocha speculum, Strain CCMP1381" /LENGTH=155 /DNA_ID=CAMNT_0028429063 /DNA_START=46 /DNA_END=513 /DNA_ORIENTATION=+
MLPMMPVAVRDVEKLHGYDTVGFDATGILGKHSIWHTSANGVHGVVDNSLLGQLYRNTGFHPFNDMRQENVERMKIMVSYGENDTSSPESHGEYMVQFYSEKCNQDGKIFKNAKPADVLGNSKGGKCLVNYKPGGHVAHFIPFFKADLLRKVLEL